MYILIKYKLILSRSLHTKKNKNNDMKYKYVKISAYHSAFFRNIWIWYILR